MKLVKKKIQNLKMVIVYFIVLFMRVQAFAGALQMSFLLHSKGLR